MIKKYDTITPSMTFVRRNFDVTERLAGTSQGVC